MLALRKNFLALAAALALLVVAGCGDGGGTKTATYSVDAPPAADGADAPAEPPATPKKPKVTIPDGPPPKELKVEDLEEGSGEAAKNGDQLQVHYVGVSYSDGKEFDNSYDRGQPFDLPLGGGQVIKGWDRGLVGMKAGGRRKLTIPPDLGYGAAGSPPAIKPDETLVFVVDLVAIR